MSNIREIKGNTGTDPLTQQNLEQAANEARAQAAKTRAAARYRDVSEIGSTSAGHGTGSNDVTSLPPPSPLVPILNPEDASGAKAFANQLLSLEPGMSLSDTELVCSFLKLQSLDASVNQTMEGEMNQARHYLREAAFILERRLSSRLNDVPALRAEAGRLEDEAEQEFDRAIYAMDSGDETALFNQSVGEAGVGGIGSANKQDGVSKNANAPSAKLEAQMWNAAFTSLIASLREAAAARSEAKALGLAGDYAGAQAKTNEAIEAERSIAASLAIAGLPATEERIRALEQAAVDCQTQGKSDRDVLPLYFAAHPEDLQQVMPGATVASVVATGFGAEELGGLVNKAPNADELKLSVLQSLAITDESQIQGAVEQSLAGQPSSGQGVGGASGNLASGVSATLASAGGKMLDAIDMYNRANLILSAYNDAQQATQEARRYEQTYGVTERMARRQKELLDALYLAMAGDRVDQQQALDARKLIDQARNEVAKLVLQLVDRDAQTKAGRRR